MKFFSLIALLIVVFTSSGYTNAATKTIGILVFDGVLTSDITAPAEVFGIAGKQPWFSDYEVKLINVTNKPTITTEEGLTIAVDSNIDQQKKLNTLIVPSSYSMTPLLKNHKLITFIKQQHKELDWIASNCSGSELLAQAGVLDGKRATTWAGGEADLQKQFPKVNVQTDANYVVDGNVITSNGSVVSYTAALKLLTLMSNKGAAQEVFDTIQLGRLISQY